jgi:hypothetical protein
MLAVWLFPQLLELHAVSSTVEAPALGTSTTKVVPENVAAVYLPEKLVILGDIILPHWLRNFGKWK